MNESKSGATLDNIAHHKNCVFIATSIDGYITDKNGGLDWLHAMPNPDHDDMGYAEFMSGIDALIMGRTTFETVCAFDIDWPYEKPVFVLSTTLTEVEEAYQGKVFLMKGTLTEILDDIHKKGLHRLYIDGGATIRNFLKEDLIDEMILTTLPIVLGGGAALFSELPKELSFTLKTTKTYLKQVTQQHYIRNKE